MSEYFMRCVCSVCHEVYATKPCSKEQAGRDTHGLCPLHKQEAIDSINAEFPRVVPIALRVCQAAHDITPDSFAPLPAGKAVQS